MSFDFGTVVLVPFPYTNMTGGKRRPAVVISSPLYESQRPDVVVLAITSRIPVGNPVLQVVLSDWRGAGLAKPSAVKPVALTVEKSVILRRLGHCTDEDRSRIESLVLACFGPGGTSPAVP